MKTLSVALQRFLKSRGELRTIAVLLLLGSGLSHLQSSPLQQGSSSASTVLITARSNDAAAVELAASDLAIKIDGKAAPVRQVRRLSGTPLHYCVLFDTSRSQQASMNQQRSAALELLAKVIHAGTDRGWFVPFSDDPRPGPETDSPSEIEAAIRKEQPKGGTALYDAMVSCSERMRNGPPDPGLRAMFIFSDGQDNESRLTVIMTVEALLKAQVRVYVAGAESKTKYPRTSRALQMFAASSGGKIYLEKEKASAIIADIADDLANLYAVEYMPPDRKSDNRVHSLEVKCNKRISVSAPDRYLRP